MIKNNQSVEDFYKLYQKKNPQAPQTYTAWSFGGDDTLANELADLVVKGIKTATASNHLLYELEKEPLPKPGLYSVILDRAGRPCAIIEITKVDVIAYQDVDAAFAYKEGEGDRSLRYWCSVHEPFFTKEMEEIGRSFSPEMLIVCEEFAVRFLAHK